MVSGLATGGIDWWKMRLERLNDLFLADPDSIGNFREPPFEEEYVKRGTLAEPGATERDLAELEERLGVPLCPSYRALLQVSNGFGVFGQHVGRLLSTKDVDWYPRRNPGLARDIEKWLAAGQPNEPHYEREPKWEPEWRVDIPLRSIETAEYYDGCELLLYPKQTDPCGEWQVWLGICGIHQSYETLPDYIDYTIGQFEQRHSRP
jgi:hypothetical protein